MHTRYSGYPGGLKVETLDALIARSGHGEVVRKAIYGMLPHNKLRAKAMKRLSVEE
jgi:large subunit ribosomal protein L13